MSVDCTGRYSRSAGVLRHSSPHPRTACTRIHVGTGPCSRWPSSRRRSPASACTNTEIVEVEQPRFNPAPDSVAGFLGLYDVPTNQTTCGNCHVNNQTEWSGTKHADAYAYPCNAARRRGAADLLRLSHRVGAREHLCRGGRARWLELRPRYGLSQRAVRELPRPGTYPRHQPEYHEHPARERPDTVERRDRERRGWTCGTGLLSLSFGHAPSVRRTVGRVVACDAARGAQVTRRKPPRRAAWRATAAPRRWRS